MSYSLPTWRRPEENDMARRRTSIKGTIEKPTKHSESPKRKAPPPRSRFTDAGVKRLPAPATGNKVYSDGTVAGFGLRVTEGGNRSFVLEYRVRGTQRKRRYTIGAFPDWTTTGARSRAQELKRLIDMGADPLGELEEQREAPTVSDLIERFEQEHLSRKRESTRTDYGRMIKNHIAPHFGKHTKVADVSFADIERLHTKISARGHRYRANAVVRVASKMFNLAIRWGMRDDNPCKGVEKNTEYQRRRYLKPEELERLVKALAAHPNQQAANAIRLLLLTGARRGEVLAARWADIDLGSGLWSKPPSSVKQDENHEVPLSAPARQLLSEIREALLAKHRQLPEYVFPGGGDAEHVVNIKRSWRSILKVAGITGLRLHDLRHSYASELVSGGSTLALVGALLGHASVETTKRYSHLYRDPLRAATERVGAVITAAGKPTEEPTPIRRGR
jgi:integrase